MSHADPDQRYARQIQFAAIGKDGQRRISAASVAVLGCGALGTVAAEILARSGVGRLRLIDRDVVEWTNLQRQSLFDEAAAMAGSAKSVAAAERLAQINSSIDIEAVVTDVRPENIVQTLGDVDLVIDAADNFTVRYLLNDWSLSREVPWVHGGCVGAIGQVRLFGGLGRPCFRCLAPEPPDPAAVETCDTAGVIGSATHLIASLQATEAIKWLSGDRAAVRAEVLSVDLWRNQIRAIAIAGSLTDQCPACRDGRLEYLDGSRGDWQQARALCGRAAVQFSGGDALSVDLGKIGRRWHGLGEVQTTPYFVRLQLTGHSVTVFRDGRSVITGTSEISQARILYDRWVGG